MNSCIEFDFLSSYEVYQNIEDKLISKKCTFIVFGESTRLSHNLFYDMNYQVQSLYL